MAAAIGALLGALVAAPAGALSLLDLVEGRSLTAGNGVRYENFAVTVKGKLTRDLGQYEVVATGDGFAVTGDEVATGRGRRSGSGRLEIRYDVSTSHADGLLGTLLGILPGQITAKRLSVKTTLLDGEKKLAKLSSRLGDDLEELALDGLPTLRARERIRLGGGFGGASVASGFTAVPEPSTGVLVALGLAAAAALRVRRV
jgi:hypothetical protein